MVRLLPDGREARHEWRINPQMPILREASAIHGISSMRIFGAVSDLRGGGTGAIRICYTRHGLGAAVNARRF